MIGAVAERTVDLAAWKPHPEVWLMIAAVAALGYATQRIVGPKCVPTGESPTTRNQRRWFWSALALLWLVSDWPMHDVAEQQLYLVHMIQHLLISLVIAPMFLLATPRWLVDLLAPSGGAARNAITWLSRPVVAGLQFAALGVLTHWAVIVNLSLESGPFHFMIHVSLVFSSLLFWTPVCGPFPELRMSRPGQMIYLFIASIPPTVPGAWLAIAEGVVYSGYDKPDRLWGIDVTTDQQIAGLTMKLVGGGYLWVIITTLFVRWAGEEERATRRAVRPRPPASVGASGNGPNGSSELRRR